MISQTVHASISPLGELHVGILDTVPKVLDPDCDRLIGRKLTFPTGVIYVTAPSRRWRLHRTPL